MVFGQAISVNKDTIGKSYSKAVSPCTHNPPPPSQPWETVCIAEDFPYQITCGDACDDGTLIVTTQADGTYFIFKGLSTTVLL